MSVEALKKRLLSDSVTGVFLLCGDDEYTKDYYAKQIVKKSCPQLPEMNHIVFDAEKEEPQALASAVEGYPYMAETKLVEVKNLLPAKLTEKDAIVYASVIESIPEFCALLFKYSAEEFNIKKVTPRGKSKGASILVSAIKKYGIIAEFTTPKEDKLVSWVIRHFKSEKVPISVPAARYLVEYCGSDMYVLASEINKLAMACAGREVTEKDIENICCPNTEYRVFDMTRALIEGNDTKAIKIFEGLKFYKTEPVIILGTLAKLISDMSIIKSAADAGISSAEITAASGISAWQVKKNLAFLRGKDGKFLMFAARECLSADMRIKTSGEDPYVVLETLIARISSYGRK